LGRLDAIIHCATEYGRKNTSRLNLIESNFVFPLNLLDSAVAGGVTAFINIDTMLPTKTSNYSLSKSQFRQWLPSISQEIKIANIRMEHFYGPNDDSSKFVSYVVQSLLNKAEAIPLTAGNQKRDFIYIDDAVNAIITILRATLLDSRDAYVEYELGSGSVISIKEMLEMAKAISGNTKTILKFGAIPYRESEEMELAVDLRALKKLGWSPQYSLDSGLKKMIEIEERHK
jgi:nucleoside-diphosphate-sugar epimerase